MARACLLCIIILAAGGATSADLPVLKVEAGPRIAFAPANIDLVVIAKPDAKNRYLAISLGAMDSAFAGSSQRSLDGENERGELARVQYRNVPAGNYQLVVTLFDRQGKQIAQRSADVRRIGRGQ